MQGMNSKVEANWSIKSYSKLDSCCQIPTLSIKHISIIYLIAF